MLYTYHGNVVTSFTLGNGQDVVLAPGMKPVDLPSTDNFIKTLEAQDKLIRVPEKKKSKTEKNNGES